MKSPSRHRWVVVVIFFIFILLHQSDRLLIGPLESSIRGEFGITKTQMGAVSTVALLVAAVLYPVWGYLYDRYARAKLLALASFIWGSTTWLNAIAPNYGTFLVTRASTGIDDSSYPGLHSIIADYFGPNLRGKIYGVLQLAQPIGFMLGMMLALMLKDTLGWRAAFFITGSLGVALAVVIYLSVKEPPRGKGEPELADLEEIRVYRFNWQTARALFRKPTLLLLFVQGFFGVFPWNVIAYWIFTYLGEERGYDDNTVMITMLITIPILSGGYFLGGWLGDRAFRRTPRGRMMVSITGVVLGAIFLAIALSVPNENSTLFMVFFILTAIFMPWPSPNMLASVYDITLPEVRSTALAIQMFIENGGAATAPLLAGMIADALNLKAAFLIICSVAWALCALFYTVAAYLVPRDIGVLRAQMRERAALEQTGGATTGD